MTLVYSKLPCVVVVLVLFLFELFAAEGQISFIYTSLKKLQMKLAKVHSAVEYSSLVMSWVVESGASNYVTNL